MKINNINDIFLCFGDFEGPKDIINEKQHHLKFYSGS